MGRRAEPTRHDATLGRLRRCPTCREWWPDDAEFFTDHRYEAGQLAYARGRPYIRKVSGNSKRCRACHYATQRESDTRRRLRTAQSRRMTGHCHTLGCIVMVPPGRDRCHGCAGRLAGALTPERIRELLSGWRRAAAA